MREVSTFVYESEPNFFKDPFFLRGADPAVLAQLRDPARQAQMRASKSAQRYKVALEVALANTKNLFDAGVTIASDAARCSRLDDVGFLRPGQWADFMVLKGDPVKSSDQTKTLEAVYIAGNQLRR